jgi:hypothetical protein
MTILRPLALSAALLVGLALLGAAGAAQAQQNKLIGTVTAVDAAASTFSVAESDGARTMDFRVDGKSHITDRVTKKGVRLADLALESAVSVTYVDAEEGVALVRHMQVTGPKPPAAE